jgi:hypothetical protein
LVANYETRDRYFLITELNTSSELQLEVTLHALLKKVHNSMIINHRGNELKSQKFLRGNGKKKRRYSTEDEWCISLQFLDWTINPTITDREHMHSTYWLNIKKIHQSPPMSATSSVFAKRKFIRGKQLVYFVEKSRAV